MGIVMSGNKLMMSGNKIVSYTPPPIVEKGTIVNLDLDGDGDKQYRVLKCNGNVAQVMAMYNDLIKAYDSTNTTTTFGSTTAQKYEESTLDTYLNTTWYNTLTSATKVAIVSENVVQHCYQYYDKPNTINTPTYTYQYENNWFGSYRNANDVGNVIIGERNVFVLDLKDIYDYFGKVCITSDELMILFHNQTTTVSNYIWLRSAYATNSSTVWGVNGNYGYFSSGSVSTTKVVRPVLNLNLSSIPFTIAT